MVCLDGWTLRVKWVLVGVESLTFRSHEESNFSRCVG